MWVLVGISGYRDIGVVGGFEGGWEILVLVLSVSDIGYPAGGG